MTPHCVEAAFSPRNSACSNSGDGAVPVPSLHDCPTNSPRQPLRPINEEEEAQSSKPDIQLAADEDRSLTRTSKNKNFKDLKIDMNVVKNNHARNVDMAIESKSEQLKIYPTLKSPKSPNLPSVGAVSPNLPALRKPPNLSPEMAVESKSEIVSLSEEEEIFECLSNEITDNLSEDEEIFDKLSMQLDIENEDELEWEFNNTLHESSVQGNTIQKDFKALRNKPTEVTTDVESINVESEASACSVQNNISYWERRSSQSRKPSTVKTFPALSKNDGENFKRCSLQRSGGFRKSKKTRFDLVEAVETGCDGHAAPVPVPRRGSLRAKEKTSHLPSRGAGPAVSRAEHIIFSLKSWEQRRTETRKLPQKTLLEWF